MQRLTMLLATVAFAGMALVDPQVASGSDLTVALMSRLVACVLFMLAFAGTYLGDWAVRFARPLSIAHCYITGFEVILLTYLTGGGDSSYHEALHVTMFGYALLPFPWRRWDGLMVFGAILLTYDAVLVFGDRPGTVTQLLSHNALLIVSAMVCVVFERVIKASKLRDFESRRALADANERLTALDTAKTRFFSNISHELRTPLTLIVAPLEALLESSREPLSAGQHERLRLAQRNALRLLRLLDDLLSLTRAEAAALKLHVTGVDLTELVRAFASEVQDLAARKQITLTAELPSQPTIIEGDATLIERVLLNVVGNAAKFSRLGGRITIRVKPDGDGYELAVADDGVGIAEEHLPRVFDRFYQADNSSTRTTGGTGIGLALVKEIVDLHGGHVRAESTLGAGTTMRCWLPSKLPPEREANALRSDLRNAEPQGLPEWHQEIRKAKSYRLQGIDDATERRVAPRPRHRGDAPTILVVEDNPDMIRFLVALMAYDFNVLSAQNGKDGLRMALERRPDLIISDVMMPEMDGFEMVRRLRQDPQGAKIPLIFLTARGGSDDRIEGHAGGADTYLAKPFRSEELLAAVDALLTRQESVRESATTHQDESLVFMASGMLEHVQRALAALTAVHGSLSNRDAPSAAALESFTGSLENLAHLVGGLRELTDVGSVPVLRPALIDDALRSLAAIESERLPTGRKLQVELQAPSYVKLTEEELRAVVAPLLERAIEVTPAGGCISLQTLHNRATGGAGSATSPTVSIVIRDEGPALTANQVERLFFPFLNVDANVKNALELARARRIVLTRGGSISIEPGPDLGSRITVKLPLHELIAPEADAPKASASEAAA